ncbi:hypothetical protein MOE57_07790 [Bacillus inaquosorum]|uniref:hypothetical protein n=1 Tax=Bacillus inaquosorum TaxID=483913 RepID=UPI00227E673F|nr:hypothetical protein [Bacillus inaquosorum]MCY9082384.1 hypothetical protein [Bacillus inaquosorum]
MNEYKISLSHDLVFHKRSNGVCTVTQGTDILPIELETAVNLLAEEIIEQQDKIDENKRQQEVTVHQFRQAQEEIQRITKESDGFKQALEKIAALKPSTNNDINACNFQFAITTANLALEGAAE